MTIANIAGRRIRIRGTVQGVGFRPWVYRQARRAGVTGRVRNDARGVSIDAFGDEAALGRFVDALGIDLPPAARIVEMACVEIPAEAVAEFAIVASAADEERRVSIPPDLATCDACATEIVDPRNRRYRYPFTNCTNCGPRFTIATDIPYDRAATTMARFEMCETCGREYASVDNRRFHAQPNACPNCGPRLTLADALGRSVACADVLAEAARAIQQGQIVALKGLGGFHLACDATSREAVQRLRSRKHRDEKPFAVMVADLAAAHECVVIDDEARRLLTSVERPIVLLPDVETSAIAPNVAPGNRLLGVMLPYTPLHRLLLADAGRPLVMTSGNLSDEPIAYGNDEALARLGAIADLFVLHDRAIQTRCDDSVVAMVVGQGVLIRRSRGYVPRPIALRSVVSRPVLGCGGLLKNTFCLVAGDSAWFGPHIGDLENVDTYEAYVEGIERLERFLQIAPAVVAHDLHPAYDSTNYARSRAGAIAIAVQHHHAHVVSAMAEHQLEGPVIGVAYDGTGYGTDGTMWGGEVLLATEAAFERLATFRPVALAGGDRAIREPWRIALALMVDAYGPDLPADALALFAHVPSREIESIRTVLQARLNTPLARGVGRYFDAFGALFLRRTRASFEGQTALEWNQAADARVSRGYRFSIDASARVPEIDLRQALRDAIADAAAGAPVSAVAAAFHNTIVEATASVVRRAAARVGQVPVVATGGCFQNARLAEGVRAALEPEYAVHLHAEVPPGDGGIALGQAVIADAILRSR